MPSGDFCYWIDPTQDTEKHGGFVPSAVFANERGHYPMVGNPDKFQAPWVWGTDYKKAVEVCNAKNADMGLEPKEVARILLASMSA